MIDPMNDSEMYRAVLTTLFVCAPTAFVILLIKPAPYGRYRRREGGLPARSAWFWMELPAVIVPLLFGLIASRPWNYSFVLLAFWETHYIYRTFIYTHRLRGGPARRFPISLALLAIVFNALNGFANGYHLFRSGVDYNSSWFVGARFILGSLLFLVGLMIHIGSDRRLRKLRETGIEAYSIPRGGLFDYVSAPNYFGEIVQWCGWAIATWSLPGLAFALFTAANLLPRGLSHHRWYMNTYEGYPPKRKAVIPFLL